MFPASGSRMSAASNMDAPKLTDEEMKLTLAFEYGVILSQVALEHKKELTPELMTRIEQALLEEFKQTPEKIAVNMPVNVLAMLEPNL